MKSKKKFKKKYYIIALLIIIALILIPYTYYNTKTIKTDSLNPLSKKGFIEVNINATSSVIYLIKDCEAMIMTTAEQQTYSVFTGLQNTINVRPTTHDIIKNILDNYNIEVPLVKITKLEKDLYYAELFLRKDDKILNIDIRPSDAIAIAVRTHTPIYIKKEIFDSKKEKIC